MSSTKVKIESPLESTSKKNKSLNSALSTISSNQIITKKGLTKREKAMMASIKKSLSDDVIKNRKQLQKHIDEKFAHASENMADNSNYTTNAIHSDINDLNNNMHTQNIRTSSIQNSSDENKRLIKLVGAVIIVGFVLMGLFIAL